MMTLHIQ